VQLVLLHEPGGPVTVPILVLHRLDGIFVLQAPFIQHAMFPLVVEEVDEEVELVELLDEAGKPEEDDVELVEHAVVHC